MAEFEDSGLLSKRPRMSPREAAEQRWGTVVAGRYRVEELLSFDDMGALYRARDTERGVPCALRVLPAIYARNPEIRDRFLRDAEAAQVLRHPNIVEVLDTGKLEDGGVYSVMELLDGQNLKTVLEEEGRIGPGRAVHIASQVCRALGTAHEMGIVHRDLKPGNIVLVAHEGDLDFVKILDFGICSHFDSESSATASQDKLIGSPDYMAPEQAAGADANPSSDIYAIGVVLFEMLSGRMPYTGRNAIDVLMKKGGEDAPRVTEFVREVPDGLAEVVAWCLARRPSDRPSSMRVLEVELLRALDPRAPRPVRPTTEPTVRQAYPEPPTPRPEPSAVMRAPQPIPLRTTGPVPVVEAAMAAAASMSNGQILASQSLSGMPTTVVVERPLREGEDRSNAWMYLVGAGALAVVLVLFGPRMFGGGGETSGEAGGEPTPAASAAGGTGPEASEERGEAGGPSKPTSESGGGGGSKPTVVDDAVLVGRAEVALAEGRLCEPAGESLRDHLEQLAKIDASHEAIGRLRSKVPDEGVAQGKRALTERRYHDAGQIFRCVLGLAPDAQAAVQQPFAEALVGEGKILRTMKAWDDLLPLLEERDKLGVKPSFDALVLRGQAMAGKGRWSEAVQAFSAALEMRSSDKDVRKQLDEAKKQAKANK